MKPLFSVRSTTRFERLVRRHLRGHRELPAVQERAWHMLQTDPYNRSRQYQIKKLEGVVQGNGQYRLSLGRWRFRYDIYDEEVVVQFCGLRREDTYR
ncbi:MAG: hypothetical protein HY650_07695 [Acidobacteria bacterium]|nr:hypothetical protein [Acidobacteriota bacterium]